MEHHNTTKAMLPPPSFGKESHGDAKLHYLTPSGLTLLPREKQPPPMYGPRGATVPPRKFLYEMGRQMNRNAPSDRPPERHFCEPCEMELQSGEDLRLHSSQHEQCPVNGCRFRGHTSVMDKHVTALHSSGLSDKVKKLNTPEEIAAWREERRKRFPTLANVQMRQRAQEQRQKRGERLEGNRSRFGNRDGRHPTQKGGAGDKTPSTECHDRTGEVGSNNNKGYERKPRKRKKFQKGRQTQQSATIEVQGEKVESVVVVEEGEHCAGVFKFRGTSAMKGYKHIKLKKKEPGTNALDSLAGMYGSDDDSTDDTDVETEEVQDESNNVVKEIAVEEKVIASDSRVNDMQDRKFREAENSQTHVEQCAATFSNHDCIADVLPELQKVDDNSENSDKGPPCEAPIERSSNLPPPAQDRGASNPFSEKFKPSPRDQTNSRVNDMQDQKFREAENSQTHVEQCAATFSNHECIGDVLPELQKVDDNSESLDEGPPCEAPIERSSNLPPRAQDRGASNPFSQQFKPSPRDQTNSRCSNVRQYKRQTGLDYHGLRLRKQNTMLEKLLEADIRHERNVLLQCVRFVCENNFFGIGGNAATKSTTH